MLGDDERCDFSNNEGFVCNFVLRCFPSNINYLHVCKKDGVVTISCYPSQWPQFEKLGAENGGNGCS